MYGLSQSALASVGAGMEDIVLMFDKDSLPLCRYSQWPFQKTLETLK